MSLTGRCDRQHSSLDNEFGQSLPSLLTISKHSNYLRGFLMFYLKCVPIARAVLLDKQNHVSPILTLLTCTVKPTYLTKHRRHILLRRLGGRNKSDTRGLVWAASSSSCMVDLKTFNDNDHDKLFSCHNVVGIVRPQTEDKMDRFPFCHLY